MSAHGFTRRPKAQRAEGRVVTGLSGLFSVGFKTGLKEKRKKKTNQTVVVGAGENRKTRPTSLAQQGSGFG
jgi:hypothetical protein